MKLWNDNDMVFSWKIYRLPSATHHVKVRSVCRMKWGGWFPGRPGAFFVVDSTAKLIPRVRLFIYVSPTHISDILTCGQSVEEATHVSFSYFVCGSLAIWSRRTVEFAHNLHNRSTIINMKINIPTTAFKQSYRFLSQITTKYAFLMFDINFERFWALMAAVTCYRNVSALIKDDFWRETHHWEIIFHLRSFFSSSPYNFLQE